MHPRLQTLYTGIAVLALSACAGGMTIGGRVDNAQSMAASGGLIRSDMKAPPFILASWQRITDPAQPVNVYIEGDGLAWLSRTQPSMNPTPKNAVGLSLATLDPAPNVVYIARPCQFTDLGAPGNDCRDVYWRGKRFAPEVIESFMAALDQVAVTAHGGFNLIGYSGGANVAGLLASRRPDVLTLRTVAGNIDNDAFVSLHDITPMAGSLNMADNAAALGRIPQFHFIAGKDDSVPLAIFTSYMRKAGGNSCIHSKVLPGVSHTKGWEEQWPTLLTLPMTCSD